MPDKKTASYVQSLCMGEIEEEIIIPFPEMAEAEKETLGQVLASVRQLLNGREKEFREWDAQAEMPGAFLEELRQFGLFGLVIPEAHGGHRLRLHRLLAGAAGDRQVRRLGRRHRGRAQLHRHARPAALRHRRAEGHAGCRSWPPER